MAIAFGAPLGAAGASVVATTIAVTTTAAVPAGGRIVLAVSWYNVADASASGGGLTWTLDYVHNSSGDANYSEALLSAHAPAGLASGTVITVTFSVASYARTVLAAYWTGIADSGFKDGGAGANGSGAGTPWNAGSLTTTNANDVLIGGAWIDFTSTDSTPNVGDSEVHDFQNTANGSTHTMTYRIVSATGTYSLGGLWTSPSGQVWQGASVAYQAAVTAPPATAAGQMGWGAIGSGNLGPSYGETVAGTAWEQSIADSVEAADSVLAAPHARAVDTLTVADATAHATQKPVADSVTVTDAIRATLAVTIADSLGIADSLSRQVAALMADVAAVADAVTTDHVTSAAAREQTIADSLAVADSLGLLIALTAADSLALADSLTFDSVTAHHVQIADVLGAGDTTTTDRPVILVRGKPRISIGGGLYV